VARQVQHKKRNSLDVSKNPANIPKAASPGSAARGIQLTLTLLRHRIRTEWKSSALQPRDLAPVKHWFRGFESHCFLLYFC
jgi:hypothetical protein